MENSFKSVMETAKAVLILLPKNPYFDQVAAALSLYLSLEKSKSVIISCPSPMLVEFNRLVGVNRVTSELGSKNLVVKFLDYDPENIERVSYDIENKEFRLTVIPKPQVAPPNKDQVKVTFSGVSADTIVLIGGINDSHFPALSTSELTQAKVIHIGTQDFQSPAGKSVISLAKPASSVSELVAGFIKELDAKLNPDLASNLLAGIHEGSRNFTHSEVNSNTFKLVAELMEAGGNYAPRQSQSSFKPAPRPFAPKFQPRNPALPRQSFTTQSQAAPASNPSESQNENQQEPEKVDNPPASWLEPKIFKGTSVS